MSGCEPPYRPPTQADAKETKRDQRVFIVMTNPPGPTSEFVETENADGGYGPNNATWTEHPSAAGLWRLGPFYPAPAGDPSWTSAGPIMDAVDEYAAAITDRRVDPSGAVKADVEKVRMDLLPMGPLQAIAAVLGFGAEKYGADNWRKGFEWSRIYGATLRHLAAWQLGEDLDPETGLPHLAHANTNLLFLLEYAHTGAGTDDRPKETK